MTGEPGPQVSEAAGPQVPGGLSSVQFAELARLILQAARRAGADRSVGFRSPPRDPSMSRSLRSHSDGGATVSVTLRARNGEAVAADMVEGVMAANGLTGQTEHPAWDAMWETVEGFMNRVRGYD